MTQSLWREAELELVLAAAPPKSRSLSRFLFLILLAAVPLQSFSESSKELRVYLPVSLPVDPLHLKSMAEYDCSLLLYRTWLNYDLSRKAKPGLIENWHFQPDTDTYRLTLGEHKWSDGTKIEAAQLVQNLKRIIESGTTYGKSLTSIINAESLKAPTDRTITFKTRTGEPSEGLFNQLGSIFLALVHPSDFGLTKKRLKNNKIASGPYVIASETEHMITFKRNPHYKFTNNDAPTVILARKGTRGSIDEFLSGKNWANYLQVNTFLGTDRAIQVKKSGLPYWTRGADRVMLLKPLGTGTKLSENQRAIRRIAPVLRDLDFSHPLQVKIAKSLQPVGYPLHEDIVFPHTDDSQKKMSVEILTMDDSSLEMSREFLTNLAKKAKLDIKWKVVSAGDFLSQDWNNFGSDLALFSFGVADPEPTTWLGLVFGSKLIQFTSDEMQEFNAIAGLASLETQIGRYKALLKNIALRGGYLPLLHGATLSLGKKGMNFENVAPLDETVDYSKIIMRNE